MADAVVLAGGRIPERETEFREAVGVDCKSLTLNGRIMVRSVFDDKWLRHQCLLLGVDVGNCGPYNTTKPGALADPPSWGSACRERR